MFRLLRNDLHDVQVEVRRSFDNLSNEWLVIAEIPVTYDEGDEIVIEGSGAGSPRTFEAGEVTGAFGEINARFEDLEDVYEAPDIVQTDDPVHLAEQLDELTRRFNSVLNVLKGTA